MTFRTLGALALAALCGLFTAPLGAQVDERIQRDQAEILRRAERLEGLMLSLKSRYDKEGDQEKVALLEQGLGHLRASGLLDDIAQVRNDIDSGAWTEALRRQTEVVGDLEALLDILLERRSVESLAEEIERTEALRAAAAELRARQEELGDRTRESRSSRASEAEAELAEQLDALAGELRREADENQRQAGSRRPTLEAALDQVTDMLRELGELETQVADERASDSPSEAERTQFDLGELAQRQRRAQADLQRADDLERMAKLAAELERALESGDRARARQLRDRMQSELAESQNGLDERQERERRELEGLETELAERALPDDPGGESDAEREALRATAERVRDAARQQAEETAREARRSIAEMADAAREMAERTGDEESEAGARRAIENAEEALKRARDSEDDARAAAELSEAARRTAEARRALRDANPDAETRANQIASDADRTARGLKNASVPDAESPEREAAAALDQARDALRSAGEGLGEERADGESRPERQQAIDGSLEGSRSALEAARDLLSGALQGALEGRQDALEAASERQAALTEQARQLAESLRQAGAEGGIQPEQAEAAEPGMQSALDAMQQAQQSLESGRQANAANDQQQAADSLEDAAREMARNRPLNEEDRAAMREIAERQQELKEDIIRLQELVEERENQRAAQALQQAQQAAERAEEALRRGDAEEAERQQQEAQEQLERAERELARERDRYQDLRQEELLFRIQDELQQFMEAQRPITAETRDAGEQLADGKRLTRPMRRGLNQLGQRERELRAKIEFIRESLAKEGTLVFTHVLESNEVDLEAIAERLSGRRPDAGEFTQQMQLDVEERTEKLLAAIEQERERRQQQQGQQQQEPQDNEFGPQQQRLVPILSELIMLRQMEEEMMQRTQALEQLVQSVGADGITEVEAAMAERLAHQHNSLTRIFEQLKAQLEQAMQPQSEDTEEERNR